MCEMLESPGQACDGPLDGKTVRTACCGLVGRSDCSVDYTLSAVPLRGGQVRDATGGESGRPRPAAAGRGGGAGGGPEVRPHPPGPPTVWHHPTPRLQRDAVRSERQERVLRCPGHHRRARQPIGKLLFQPKNCRIQLSRPFQTNFF